MTQLQQDIDQAAVEAVLNDVDAQPAQQPAPAVAEPVLEDNNVSLFISPVLGRAWIYIHRLAELGFGCHAVIGF